MEGGAHEVVAVAVVVVAAAELMMVTVRKRVRTAEEDGYMSGKAPSRN